MTPGPWKYDFFTCAISTDEANPAALALIYADAPDYEANARLIAAAPDLLEACEALLNSHRPGLGQCCAASDLGIAALAKARGETQ